MPERVLIIDDEEHIRRMMRLTLETAGYAVGEAGDGFEGLKNFGDGANWDVVVLDQRMPGIDGLETLRRLKASDAGVRVVMATAYASIELAVEAMKLGAADFVRKPMTPEMLRNAVAAVLARSVPIVSATAPVLIETITMNGFSILDPAKDEWQVPEQRRFTVVSPTGMRHEVLVQIDEEVMDYVERLTHRRLPYESSFWTDQARRLLADHLWTKGEAPRIRRLVLDQLDRDAILMAERWKE
ncbi:MAG TPA: response regulator [Pyrinomonadaceae bacterium]|jgi:DNA-binding response OmpR family regulator